ncbi:MAG: amidohydrolase family protein [Vicinamibacterales bacterium]|nr:amidohydrolase family protein [Vicinamibacterales bacterium]
MSRSLMLVLAATMSVAGLAAQPGAPRVDLILRGGTILDGTGAPRFAGDVAVAGGVIVGVGDLGGMAAAEVIDVRGLYVTPGFINLHSHPTPGGLQRAENMLTQGVTTEILNPDGGGPLDVAEQLAALGEAGLAVNVGANIGFNSLWTAVVGQDDRRATPGEIERMRALLVAGLEAGAWGVSAGLDYKPAYYATTEEAIAVVGAAAPWRTNFTNHDRLTPESNYSSRAGVAETLAIGRRAGVVPIVTHMKAQGHEQGTGQALIDLIQDSAAPGSVAAADVYPYLAGQSGLGALIIPGWAQDGGRDRMLERFTDPALRAKIVAESEEAMRLRFGGPSGVFVTGLDTELTTLIDEMGGVSPGEAVVRALEEANRGAILRFGSEADLVAILRGPTTSVACDCGATDRPASHPRYWGSFPRVLGRYVREQGHLTWEDAVRKMTGLPAATIGLVDRGLVAAGHAADLTVIDPAAVMDHATFERPNEPSVGIRHVLVNGRLALLDGTVTGTQAGRVLRRTVHMPSRPMNGAEARGITVSGRVGDGVSVEVDVTQPAGARAGRGRLRITDGPRTVDGVAIGAVQTAGPWSAVTAVAAIDGAWHPVLVIVDREVPGRTGTHVSVRVAGQVIAADGPLAR